MIIGISGKKQSGKSTTGEIIHQLLCPEYYRKIQGYNFVYPSWKFKSFADPIKQCASLILGIPVRDFEKEEIKSSYLPVQWNKWQVNLEGWEDYYFSTKEECVQQFQQYHVGEMLFIDVFENPEEFNNLIKKHIKEVQITVRQFLQWFGTDACRNNVHENVWVNALMNKYKLELSEGWVPTYNDPDNINCYPPAEPIYPNWIISDVRFQNEIEAIKDKGGIILRIERNTGIKDFHPSEVALDSYNFEHVIDNNGTIYELREKIKNKLTELKLL